MLIIFAIKIVQTCTCVSCTK